MGEQPVQIADHEDAVLVEQQLELDNSVIARSVITMTISLRRAPLRVLSLVGATRLVRRPIRSTSSGVDAPVSVRRGSVHSLTPSAPYSLMCWWIDEPKSVASAADPVLAVQLDLHERRISLRGRVDARNVEVLADVTATLIALNPGDSTVDISGVSIIDAAGIACIADLGGQLNALGADFKVVGAAARQRRRFGIGSLSRLREAA